MSEDQVTRATAEIHQWVDEQLGRRDVGTANRASSAPQCVKKRWFQNQGVKGEPMQPRSLIVFATGDVVEHVMKYFIAQACVGPGKLYSEVDFGRKNGTFTIQHREFDIYEQEELKISIGGVEISGHPDGWGKRNDDGEWELIEVKSASFQGFDKFVAGQAEYINQVHTLLMSDKAIKLGARSARFFYMNKNQSALFDRLYHFDEVIAAQVMREYMIAAGPNQPAIPDSDGIGVELEKVYNRRTKQYDDTGRAILGWKCGYCEYKMKCFPNVRTDFKNGRPIFVVDNYEEKIG